MNLTDQERARLAAAIGSKFNPETMDERDLIVARKILTDALVDAAVMVRYALVETMNSNPHAPRHIIKALAYAEDIVAIPILKTNELLSSDDIYEILTSSTSQAKMAAVAERPGVQHRVTDFLCANGNGNVIATLFANHTAEISAASFQRALDRVGGDPRVQAELSNRTDVPLGVIDKLLALMTDHLQKQLVDVFKLPMEQAIAVLVEPTERALIGLTSGYPDEQVEAMVQKIHSGGQLTDSMIIRAMCMTNFQFVGFALAARAGISPEAVFPIFLTGERDTVNMLLRASKIPSEWHTFFCDALSVTKRSSFDIGKLEFQSFRRRLIQRIMTLHEDDSTSLPNSSLDVILAHC